MEGGPSMTGQSVWVRHDRTRARLFVCMPGFTIIEVLIVLAVTGMLFGSAAILISGRQNQAGFDQAVQQIQSQIQQVMNDVSVGYFPKNSFRCTAAGSGPDISSAPSNGQGTNSGCIFVGKALQFKIDGTEPEAFVVHTIAGLQQTGSGKESESLTDAQPKVISPSSAEPSLPDISVTNTLQNGLKVHDMWYNDGGSDQQIGEVAFTNSLASYDGSAIKSSIQQINVVPVFGTTLGTSKVAGVNAINSVDFRSDSRSPLNPVNGVFICFVSGGTKQSGLVTIGGKNRELAVSLSIRSNLTCAP